MAQDLTVEQILNQYNAVTRGDMYSGQEVEGRVFVNGDLTGSQLNVGFNLPTSGGTVLAVRGDSDVSRISVSNGDVYIGGHANGGFERSTNGGAVYVGGAFSGNDNFGMVHDNQGDLSSHMPRVNFDDVESYSAALSGLTGQAYAGGGFNILDNAIPSEGTDWDASKVTVYNTSLSQLASGEFNTNLTGDRSMIINVSGTSGAYGLNALASHDISTRILWNFYEATDINVSTALIGSVLAPKATMSNFSGSTEGSVFAQAIEQTNGELHYQPFTGDLPTFNVPTVVPEIGAEGAMAAMVLVLGSMAVMAGRRRAA